MYVPAFELSEKAFGISGVENFDNDPLASWVHNVLLP